MTNKLSKEFSIQYIYNKTYNSNQEWPVGTTWRCVLWTAVNVPKFLQSESLKASAQHVTMTAAEDDRKLLSNGQVPIMS